MNRVETDLAGVWFVLIMNDMRSSQVEIVRPVARARSFAALEHLLARERVPAYSDGAWGKTFRRGGPLEWKNDPEVDRFGGIAKVYGVPVADDVEPINAEALARVPSVAELLRGEVASVLERAEGESELERSVLLVDGARPDPEARVRLVDPTPEELEQQGAGCWSQCDRCRARTRIPLPADLSVALSAMREIIEAHRSCSGEVG